MSAPSSTALGLAESFFGVAWSGRAYLALLYSLVAFPLGVAYFVFLSIGWTVGLGLLLVWIGIIVLAVVLAGSWMLSAFERLQAIHLLGASVEPMRPTSTADDHTAWQGVVDFLGNRVTWTGMLFLLLKFPLGVASFVLAITGLSLGFALLLAPLYYRWDPPDFYFWYVDTLPEAILCSLLGALALIVTLHLLNGVAWIWRGLAAALLGRVQRTEAPAP